MKTISIALALFALLVAGGCSKDNTATAPASTQVSAPSDLTPEQLGELGAAIRKNPSDAQRLLSERGLTEESFEQAVRKVSEDPAASQRYAAAYKQAGA